MSELGTPTVERLLGVGLVIDKGRPASARCSQCPHRWGAHRATMEYRTDIEPGKSFEAFGRVFCPHCLCDHPWTARADIAP